MSQSKPLSQCSVSKDGVMIDNSLKHVIKMQQVDLEPDYMECDTEITVKNEHTDNFDIKVEFDDDKQTVPLFDNTVSSESSRLDVNVHTNVKTRNKVSQQDDNSQIRQDIQVTEIKLEIETNDETSVDELNKQSESDTDVYQAETSNKRLNKKTENNKTKSNKAFSCNECTYSCWDKTTLIKHMKLHEGKGGRLTNRSGGILQTIKKLNIYIEEQNARKKNRSLKKQTRSTNRQIAKLVEYMALNPSFANGEYTGPLGFQKTESQWLELKTLLKEFGPDKEVEQWKQSWRDLKRKARNSNVDATKASQATGNREAMPTSKDITSCILEIIGRDGSTGIGPEESHIRETYDKQVSNTAVLSQDPTPSAPVQVRPHPIQVRPHPTPSTSASEALPLRPRRRRRRQPDSLPTDFVQLQREHNHILNRMCDLVTEHNSLMREQTAAIKRQGDLLYKLLSKK